MINYEVVEEIHKSKIWNNHIFKVRVKGKEKLYVLKLFGGINESFQKLIFNREMEALKVLNSCSNIVKIRDTTASLKYKGERNYGAILMDLVEGRTLDCYDWHKVTQLKKYEICFKILQAVYNAHANDVIHRDLKPQNIIYDDIKDEITIIDFGSSKIKTIIDKETTMPMFSESYSAYEVIKGYDITEKCDYYSLGAVFFEILLCEEASGSNHMIEMINRRITKDLVREILCAMLQENPSDRPESISDIMDVFSNMIGELNTSANEYCIFIDSDKLHILKRRTIVENQMNMSQFVNSFLKREFAEKYGYYDEKQEKYIITGLNIVIECSFNETTKEIDVLKINEIAIDRRNINIKRSFKIDGKLSFLDSRYKNYNQERRDNGKLLIMFKNRREENELYRDREEKFDRLFGNWQSGIEESIISEKDKVAKIIYSASYITNNQIVLEVDECLNKSIDELMPNSKFIVEGVDDKGQPVYFDLGTLDDVICEDDSAKMIIQMPKKALKGNVRALLKRKENVLEDFRANTSSYKRQLKAIHALRTEEYSSRNLKDILLNVEEPEEIPTIFNPKFIEEKLNDSQKQAVIKALNSENIGLIQGPPGTGKTKVIKEIIGQVIKRSVKTADSPRILIVSQSHTAVDNILEGLDKIISDDLQIVRIGADKNVSPKIACRYTMPAHRDMLFETVKGNIGEYNKNREKLLEGISDQNEIERWENIKVIQKDWIERSVEKDCLDYQMIRSATVIAGTCIGFLANSFVKDMEFDYVIIDEAAKATTPELLVSIIKAKKIILVGDQNQLPAFADERISPTIAKLTKNPEYRMFDILFETLPESHKQVLSTQYRMIENIGNLISTVFYKGTIDTGCSEEEKLHGLSRYQGNSIIWFDTSHNKRKSQKKTKGNSFMNEEEKRIILEILEDLKEKNELKNLDIGIITGYGGQKDILRNSVKAIGYDRIAQIDINVLDAFQGRENDIIMYSTVRTNDSIGFLKEKERVNVAFSRAKKLLIICGDLEFFYNYDDPNNKFIEIIDYIRTHEHCKIIPCEGGEVF
jgi:serine/threonine protein kinase